MKKLLIINLGLLLLTGIIAPSSGEANLSSVNSSSTIATQSFSFSNGNGQASNNVYLDAWRQNVNSFPDLSTYSYQIKKSAFVLELENYYENGGLDQRLSPDTYYDEECSTRCLQYIHIYSNDDFEGFPGAGSEDDPYIIEGFSLNYPKANLIQIQNTDAHVVIRNNALYGYYGFNVNVIINNAQHVTIDSNNVTLNSHGIVVTNSTDVTITNNIVSNAYGDGIFLENVDDFTIHSNQVQYNQNGIVVIKSTNGVISSNEVWSNWGTGVSLAYSDNNLITGNAIFSNGVEGLVFVDSDNNAVVSNEIYWNGYGGEGDVGEDSLHALSVSSSGTLILNAFGGSGFFIDPSDNNLVINNSISDNSGIGLYLEESGHTTISGNDIGSNGLNGIFFKDSNYNVITNNDVNFNGFSTGLITLSLNIWDFTLYSAFGGSGFFIDPSEGNVVSNNNLDNNFGNGLVLQESTNTKISSNTMNSNGLTGVLFQNSNDNEVRDNQISNNGETGLALATMSASNPFDLKLMSGFGGSGFFIDPSYNNTIDGNVLSGNTGNGLFLLESDNSVVSNNQIISNGGDGVFLTDSSHNGFTSNLVAGNGYTAFNSLSAQLGQNNLRLSGFGGSGFFIDPSNNNTLSDNIVLENAASGIYFLEADESEISNNTIRSNGFDGILFENSNMNNISYNSIEYNGFSAVEDTETSLSTLNADNLRVMGFGGSGFFIDPSHLNIVSGNNFTGNAAHGFFSEASTNTEFTDNRVMNHSLYGVVLDKITSNTLILRNNFENNNEGGTQAFDDGSENHFATNFWADHDNTDKNYDGIADEAYVVNGNANNTDSVSSNIRNGLNFYEPEMFIYPRTLKLKSYGWPVVVYVVLGDGYIAKSIDLDKLWLNGSINPYKFKIVSPLVFKLVFKRAEVIDLIKALDLDYDHDHRHHHHHHSHVVLQLTGRINDNLLDITANDEIKVNHHHHRHWNWFKYKNKRFYPIAGSVGILPIIKKRRKDENDD